MWVAPVLCNSCIPYTIDYRCRDCGQEFQVEIQEDASVLVDGERLEYLLMVSCPECESNSTLDTELEEALVQ